VEILKTKDYSIFKKTSLNRNVEDNKSHLRNLERIILHDNYLALHPIICNKDMEIIDGQHRFEIARKNNLELYYLIGDVSYNHILEANLYQKKLPIKDVIRFYAYKDNKKDYKELLDLTTSLNLNIRSLLALLFGIASSTIINIIKKGNFILPDNKVNFNELAIHYMELISFVKQRRVTPYSMFSSFHFCLAFRNLFLKENFDMSLFMSKLENKWYELTPQINHQKWYEILINIYNWKNHNPL